MKKVILIVLLALVVLVGGAALYLKVILPDVGPAPEIKVETTAEQIARGKYLANHVSVCIDCHSTRDWTKFAGPLVPGTWGKGGERFDQTMGFPGVYYSRNITPAG
ncbi:MAG: cytochrome c, partial [Hymenobacteraceae bacterium]|nr:cytochrome c [Hymenobacteraceae bacterium]MDX5395756.1 cytochrome c [Hymenobacteraceae bacterium]MDX5511811.1 cytochrome c [Hymenobacteraceae bacterium]